MRHGASTLALLLPLLGAPLATGCAGARGATVEAPRAPEQVRDLDHFYVVLNQFSLLEPGTPEHEHFRTVLLDYLIRHVGEALGDGDEPEALEALQFAAGLYRPAELRAGKTQPGLARVADRVYQVAARRGAEQPALLALAIEQQFGAPKVRKRSVNRWKDVEDWVLRNTEWAEEPLMRHEELQTALEEISAVFPSPFVSERLAALYMARYDAANLAYTRGMKFGVEAGMIEVTGYLLIRLYLRADDLDGALAAVDQVAQHLPVRKLAEMVTEARTPAKSARALLALAEQFRPEPETPPVFHTQGWGIIQNLAERAVSAHPDDAYAHHLLGQSLMQRGLYDAALVHLGRALDEREDVYELWAQMAGLHQRSLEHLAAMDPRAARQRLAKLEAFHERAVKLWRDRPIDPGLPVAYFTVAEGLYSVGEVDAAHGLLERGLTIEASPDTLDLLGTIEAKRGDFDTARSRFEAIVTLDYDDKVTRLRWEVRARGAIAELERRRGRTEREHSELDAALDRSHKLLVRPELDDDERSDALVEHGKLAFLSGDLESAWSDFRRAAQLAPDSGDVYATPLLWAVSYGYYDDALEIYQRAMAAKTLRKSLKLYFSLWVNELALRQGRDEHEQATGFLRKYEGDTWERKLALHARGVLAFDGLIAAASDPGQRAEAFFYEALQRWRSGDRKGAKDLMRKVVGTEMMSFFEYDMAQSYLEWNDVPKTARNPRRAKPQGTARARE